MTLFLSRRSYDTSTKKFTNTPSSITRFLAPVGTGPVNGIWSGHRITQEDWIARVKAEATSNEITIFVHGFNTQQPDMLRRCAKIKNGLQANDYRGALIAYDWPSEGRATPGAYRRDKKDAKTTAQYLVTDAILPLLALSPRPKINLIAHSMGAYLILRAFSEFDDASGPGNAPWKANEIMFVSGDIDQDWMGKGAWGSLLIAHRSRRFTNYFSQLDDILNAAVLFNGGRKRVGRSGMKPLIHKDHVDVYSHEQYLKDVDLEDRTPANSHRWWFDNAKFYLDLALTLDGQPAATLPTRRPMNTTDLALLS